MVLAALCRLLHSQPFVTLPGIGHLLWAAGLWLTAFLGMKILSEAGLPRAAILYPLLFLANPLHGQAIGMETFLTLPLVMYAFSLYQGDRLMGVAIVSGLAVLSRPDAIIVPAILCVDDLLRSRRLPPWKCVLAFVLILTPWAVFSQTYFGAIVPHTLAAKTAQTASGRWGTGFIFVGDLLYLVAYGLVLNPPAYGWYYTPLSVGMAMAPAIVLDRLLGEARFTSWRHARLAALALGVVLILAALVQPIRVARKGVSDKYENYVEAAAWLNEHVPKGSSLAANEIGVIGYHYHHGKVIDALGLITPEVAEHVARRDYAWYIHAYHPDYLMFNQPPRPLLETMTGEPWFREMYDWVAIIATAKRAVAIYAGRRGWTPGPPKP